MKTFKVYQEAWVIMCNSPKKMLIFAVIEHVNPQNIFNRKFPRLIGNSNITRSYRLVEDTCGAGWGNNEGVLKNSNEVFETKVELLASL